MGSQHNESDGSLAYLPPSGNGMTSSDAWGIHKGSLLPSLKTHSLEQQTKYAAAQDYLIYSDVTGSQQLRSATDPINPYAEGTDNYKFLFSYGTRKSWSTPMVPDIHMLGGHKRNPNVPGMFIRDWGYRGWFGSRHSTGGMSSKNDGSSAK